MQVEELKVKFTAATEDFRRKTDEMSQKLNGIAEISDKSKKKLEKAMKDPSERAQRLVSDMTKLQEAFIKEKNTIFEAQQRIEVYDDQMQKLSETHKNQLAETDKARQKLSELKKAYADIESVTEKLGSDLPLSEQLKKAKEETERLGEAADALQADIDKAKSNGTGILFDGEIIDEDAAEKQLQGLINKLENSVGKENAIKKAMSDLGTDKPAAELSRLSREINNAEKSYTRLQNDVRSTESDISDLAQKAVGENRKIEASQPRLERLQSAIKRTSSELKRLSGLGKIGEKLGGAISSGTEKARGAITRLGSAVSNGIKRLKNMHSYSDALTAGFKKLSLAIGGMAIIKSVFGRLKSVVSEYLQSNEQLKAKVDGLKAAFGQALAPAIGAVISVFDKLAPYLLAASNLIGDLLNKLMQLAGLKQTSGALSSVAKSTKEVAKAQNELYGFDKITKQSDNDKSSGGSSGTSGVNYEPAELGSWADQIKNAIENGDWASVGTTLGKKLNSVIEKVNFKGVGEKVGGVIQSGLETVYSLLDTIDFENIGKGAAESLNGIMDTVDFSLAGATFAKKWTALIDTVYGFVKKFDFKKCGKVLSDGINGWFNEIDFAKAGKTLGDSVKGLLDSIVGALEGIEWQQIGEKIAEFIRNIDWSGIVSRIAEGLGAAVGGAVALIWGLIKQAVEDVKAYFDEYIDGAGGNIVAGIFTGIVDALTDIGTWIKENIFDPFIEGFKKAFGINSPSKKMAEMGGYIIDGLKNGLGDIWSKVKQKFTDLWTNITGWFDKKKESLTKKWSDFTSGIKDKTAEIKAKFADKVNDIKEAWKKRTDQIKNKTASFKAKFADKVSDIKASWKSRTDSIKDKTAKISMTISDGVTGLIKKIIGGIVDILNKAINAINKVLPKGLRISTIEAPKLSTGTVVPRDFGETPVIVGDNKREIEVVSPLSTIKRAMYEVVSASGESSARGQKIIMPIYIGAKKISEVVIDDINKETEATGVCPIRI